MLDDSQFIKINDIRCFLIALYLNEIKHNSSLLDIVKAETFDTMRQVDISDTDYVDCKYWLSRQGFDFPPTEEQLVEIKLKYL